MLLLTSSVPPAIRLRLQTLFGARCSSTLVTDDCRREGPDLLIVGCFRGSTNGLEFARRIRSRNPNLPVVLLTDSGSEALAVAALRLRMMDYFAEPLDWDLIRLSLEQQIRPAAPGDRDQIALVNGRHLVGSSELIVGVKKYIARIAGSPSNVLITGETGTGKEVVAELIHNNSLRANGPFVCINCAAIPEALFESELFGHERGAFTGAVTAQAGKLRTASGGTVLLDEIGEMSLTAQAKLLRVIETRQMYPLGARQPAAVDVRFIASTNQELEQLVEERRFRKDLYFRLNVGRIRLTPLRERRTDIVPLIEGFVAEFNHAFGREAEGFTGPAIDRLVAHSWPGNVRELRNVVEAVFVTSAARRFPVEELPDYLRGEDSPTTSERDRLLSALTVCSWNKSEAARRLEWSRMTIYRKMEKYGLFEEPPQAAVTSEPPE